MRIVHLITDLSSGGAQNQLQQLVLASDKRRFGHIVVSLVGGGEIAFELKEAGIEVHSLGMKRGLPSLTGMVRLVRLLRRLKPDVLHCWLYHACLIGLLATRVVHVHRLIWGLRSANPGFRAYSIQTRAIVRLCSRLSAVPELIIVNSETGKKVHEQWGYRAARMRVIPNGTDVQRFSPNPLQRKSVREELGISQSSLLIGVIARYHPLKDHETFLQAAALVNRQHPDVYFLFAGEGMLPSNDALLQLLDKNGLRQAVRLLGPRRDTPRLTAGLDISCLSSSSESFPGVVPEAMACAVPCVVTNVGDCSSVVGDTGRVVPARDPLALAAALDELVSMKEFERAILGRRARERILRLFTLERMINAYEQLYEDSVESQRELCEGRPDGN